MWKMGGMLEKKFEDNFQICEKYLRPIQRMYGKTLKYLRKFKSNI